MKFAVLGLLCIAAIAGVFVYVQSGTRPPLDVVDLRGHKEVSVVLTDQGFEPKSFRIDRGTTVTFSTTRDHQFWPASNPHPTHDIDPQFDPQVPIEPNQTWSFTFNQPGAWGMHDHIRSYYTGTVYVAD
jgi:plastocyanin